MILGKNIKSIRKKWRMSQDDFGALFDMNKHNISSYETGKTEPSLAFMSQLQELTAIPIYELYNKEVPKEDIWGVPLKGAFKKMLKEERNWDTISSVSEPKLAYTAKEGKDEKSTTPSDKPHTNIQQLQRQMGQMQTMLSSWHEEFLELKKRVENMEKLLK